MHNVQKVTMINNERDDDEAYKIFAKNKVFIKFEFVELITVCYNNNTLAAAVTTCNHKCRISTHPCTNIVTNFSH